MFFDPTGRRTYVGLACALLSVRPVPDGAIEHVARLGVGRGGRGNQHSGEGGGFFFLNRKYKYVHTINLQCNMACTISPKRRVVSEVV